MNEPGIDLTGKLIIKVALGDDIRRILITNEDITYDELVLMMQRVYRGKLNSTDDIVIKYRDEDGDLITIFDSSDLTFAIQCSRILKITLFVNNKPEPLQTNEVKMIKAELKHIRDRCNALLDKLDDRIVPDSSSMVVDSTSNKGTPAQVTDSPRRPSPSPRSLPPPATSVAGSKEFDPLSAQRSVDDQQNKVMSSFGIANDGTSERAGTPDSISSAGSASGPRPVQQGGVPSQSGTPGQPGVPGPQPTQPAQPTQPGTYAPGSGQKPGPWQQQQQPNPAVAGGQVPGQPQGQQYPPGQGQEFSPALMRSQEWHREYHGQNTMAGHDKPHSSRSYQTALMQSVQYSGHDSVLRSSPVTRGITSVSSTSSSYQSGPKTQTSYSGSQPTSQPGYQGPQTSQYAGYGQPGQPGQAGMGQVYGGPQGQQGQPGQFPAPGQPVAGGQAGGHPMAGQQPQQQQQPQQPGYNYAGQPQQPQQQPGSMPGPTPSGGANPYARQGPGYVGGYPRPATGYPQGYQ